MSENGQDFFTSCLPIPNPKKGDKFIMDEFFFDLQRFDDIPTIEPGGDGITVSGNEKNEEIFCVKTGEGKTVKYSIIFQGESSANVSADSDGTVKLEVTKGAVQGFLNKDENGKRVAFALLSGTYMGYSEGQPIILGENGPLVTGIYTGGMNPVTVKVTSYESYTGVSLTCSSNIYNFSIGGLSYRPKYSGSLYARIENGRTYIDVNESNASDTITYNDGTTTRTYLPVSGTVTLAIDNDGSNCSLEGLDEGDEFKIDDVTYTMGSVRFTATDGTISKYWNNGFVDGKESINKIDFNSEYFSPVMFLSVDGILNISSSDPILDELDKNPSIAIFGDLEGESGVWRISYGALYRTVSEGIVYYELRGLAEDTVYEDTAIKYADRKFNAINVENGLNVSFNAEVSGVPITVYGTTFSSTDTVNSFTYTSLTSGAVSVVGATSVSLSNGLLQTVAFFFT